MKTDDFDYHLPAEKIAQTPIEPRHNSRLFVLDRTQLKSEQTIFWNLGDYLKRGDLLVVNQTRVIPARLTAHKLTGGRIELLLLRHIEGAIWEVLVGGKGMKVGRKIQVDRGPSAEIVTVLDGSRRLIQFEQPIEPYLEQIGKMPLPPYIHTPLANPERYQTVYASIPGSAAAPTAGLHFTPGLIQHLEMQGIRLVKLTLHVGLDTFAPVTEEDAQKHQIHTEWCELTPEVTQVINDAHQNGGKIVAVGTTSVRTLETAARHASTGQIAGPFAGTTDLFILPGYTFRAVDAMVTNFHLPRSTLLMLVSAFAGRERILEAYREAIRLGFRFYSFGDAMLIL